MLLQVFPLHEHPGQNRGWLNMKLLKELKQILEAQHNGDQARSRFLYTELAHLGRELSIPIHVEGSIVVPSPPFQQKAAIFTVTHQ